MAKTSNGLDALGRYRFLPKLFLYSGLLLLIFSGTIWWTKVYTNPQRVFWAMLDKSLSSTSVTRSVKQETQGNTLDQNVRLSLGAQNYSRNITAISQGQGVDSARVVTESIGTPSDDYTRYMEIDTKETNPEGKRLTFENILGVWAKNDAPQSGQQSSARYFNEALLGVIPFGNLDKNQRHSLLKLMQEQKVFDTDFNKIGQKTEKGRKQYAYRVTIQPLAYVTLLQEFTKELGLGQVEGLDQSNFEGVAPLEVQLTIDVLSRQLVEVAYAGTGRTETYSGYGLKTNVAIPTTTIPASELQNRLQTLR